RPVGVLACGHSPWPVLECSRANEPAPAARICYVLRRPYGGPDGRATHGAGRGVHAALPAAELACGNAHEGVHRHRRAARIAGARAGGGAAPHYRGRVLCRRCAAGAAAGLDAVAAAAWADRAVPAVRGWGGAAVAAGRRRTGDFI